MSFTAKCPSCRVKMRFPAEAAGASIECPKCHNFFTAAPEEEAPSPERFQRLAAVVARHDSAEASVAVTAAVPRSANNGTQSSPPAADRLIGYSLPEMPPVTPGRATNFCGVAAFLCGSVALLCASISAVHVVTIPLAMLGLVAGIAGLLVEDQRRKGVILTGLGAFVCLPVLVLGIFWPQQLSDSFGRARATAPPDSKKPLAIPSRGDHNHEPARDAGDEPMLADQGGLRLGDVQVRVLRTVPGPVKLSGQTDQPLAPENYLTITIRVANVSTKDKVKYMSWGAALGARAGHAPRLSDDQGHSYALKDFGAGFSVPGRFRGKELLPGKFVDDRLIFPEPAAQVEYLILELPAAAIGSEGALKFKIVRRHIAPAGSTIKTGQ
jgi:hypothetical protein